MRVTKGGEEMGTPVQEGVVGGRCKRREEGREGVA